MSAQASTRIAPRLWLAQLRSAAARSTATVERLPVPRVLGLMILIEWGSVLALARTVRHAGWIYYQGGDQLWYYSLGWLLGHGQLTQTAVGYGLPVMLAPIAAVAGANLVSALPAIILLNVLVLLPAAMLALYGIAARIGGRIFGYWAVTLWIVAPFIGIAYTNVGYHQRYTELLLPQAFGLTALADFPTMVGALVSVYFCSRVIFAERPQLIDAVAGGVAAGAAIAIKPSTVLFLLGPAAALAFRRLLRPAGAFLLGMTPALLALAVWKERGLGHLPGSGGAYAPHRVAAGLFGGRPVAGIDFAHYFTKLNWSHLGNNLDLLREHFWSGRVLQWLVVAGCIGLGRQSRPALLLVGAWFAAFAIVKGSYIAASIEDGSLFRIMMPAYPAFVLLLASVPLLLPGAPRRLAVFRQAFSPPRDRVRLLLVVAASVVSGVVPLCAFALSTTGAGGADTAGVIAGSQPVPANVDLGVRGRVSGRSVVLTWRAPQPVGGPVFYRIWRGPAKSGDGFSCPPQPGARACIVTLPEIGVTRQGAFDDRPGRGVWMYRVAVAANWLNDPAYGDVYFVSRPLRLVVR